MTDSKIVPIRAAQRPAPSPAVLDSLGGAITAEVRLLEDLVAIMRKQRSSVAADDLQGVDDSVFAVHRVLVTLREARRQRRALNHLLGLPEDAAVRGLEQELGVEMTDALRVACEELKAAALTLSREVELNRSVLREALHAGTDYVRALYGAPEAPRTYGAHVRRGDAETSGGMLINRRA